MKLADWLGLSGLAAIYAWLVASHWNLGHLDFGDGNYMYISWRMSEGAMLYRDILAPQPPLHLLIGSFLASMGHLFEHTLYAFRTFSLVLHIATLFLLHNTALIIARQCMSPGAARAAAMIAAGSWLLFPIGFWWTLGYQTQPLLVFLLLAVFRLLLAEARVAYLAAGVIAAAAWHTNMTAAPYVVAYGLYLLVRNTRHCLYYLLPLALIFVAGAVMAQVITGAYLENVILNQVGAYPKGRFISYATGKLLNEGGDIIRLEGPLTVLGLLGSLALAARISGRTRELSLLATLLATGCVVFMTKGGTVDYVFTLAEPYLAIGIGAGAALGWPTISNVFRRSSPTDPTPVIAAGTAAFLVIGLFMIPAQFILSTLDQRNYELKESETLRLSDMLKRRVPQDGTTLSPPHYAFIAQRKLEQDYSEHFLWQLKYWNERTANSPGRAVETILKITDALNQKKLPFLIMDENQTGNIPEIKGALMEHYTAQRQKPYETANTPLQFYIPKDN